VKQTKTSVKTHYIGKPLDKKDEWTLCTNPVRTSTEDIYCTTHLIKMGKKEPKKKKQPAKPPGEGLNDSMTANMYTDPYSADHSRPESYQGMLNLPLWSRVFEISKILILDLNFLDFDSKISIVDTTLLCLKTSNQF
jgi:hypothetical protein